MSRSKLFQQNIKNRLTSDSGFFLVSAHITDSVLIKLFVNEYDLKIYHF